STSASRGPCAPSRPTPTLERNEMTARLLVLCCLLAAACDDAKTTADSGTEGGIDASVATCTGAPPGTSCGVAQCPAECSQGSMCGRFCGGGDCYTCSGGAWTRIFYSCVGNVCAADAGVSTPDASTGDR